MKHSGMFAASQGVLLRHKYVRETTDFLHRLKVIFHSMLDYGAQAEHKVFLAMNIDPADVSK